MQVLTQSQYKYMQHIIDHPNSTHITVAAEFGVTVTRSSAVMLDLYRLDLLNRTGFRDEYFYSWTGKPFKTNHKKPGRPPGQVTAKLIDKSIQTDLTDEQIDFILNNPQMTRSQLAKALGVEKFKLNRSLEKLGIRRGVKPSEIKD